MSSTTRWTRFPTQALAAVAAFLTLASAQPGAAQEQICDDGSCTTQPAEGWIRGPEGALWARYEIVDGHPVLEGDILVEEVNPGARAAIGAGQIRTWNNATIPYTFGASLTSTATLQAAIDHVNANTVLQLVPRTSESSYLEFFSGGGCWSYVGRQGGRQEISTEGCPFGSTVHEILHAAGVWHEQSRSDRDGFVQIQYANVNPTFVSNFDMFPSGQGQDHGSYDYGSIMHYHATAFSVNGQPTIVPLQPGIAIGQRAALSPGDIAGLAALYGGATPTPPPTPAPVGMAPVASSKLMVKQDASQPAKNKVMLKSNDSWIVPPAPGTPGDPAVGGARLRIVNPSSMEQGTIELPASGWSHRANGSLRYTGSACKVTVKPGGKIRARCKGTTGGFTLDEPGQGVLGAKLELGTGAGFCAGGGLIVRDVGLGFAGNPNKAAFVSAQGQRPSSCNF